MPSLIDIRRRIRSVKNTQQITKAMKMVSAARLRRAQDRVLVARPYAGMLLDLMSNVIGAAENSELLETHPLLCRREEKRVQLVFLTSDRGLAGSFNSNLIKSAQNFLAKNSESTVELELIGRKGRDFFVKRHDHISGQHIGLADQSKFDEIVPIADHMIDRFRKREVDAVYLLYNEFKSVLTQKLTVMELLPVQLPEGTVPPDYITEGEPEQLLEALLRRYVRVLIHHALLESTAAEHAARMTAMDAATTNAAELIDKLTLYMNRIRQASITNEIIEVVSGATALE